MYLIFIMKIQPTGSTFPPQEGLMSDWSFSFHLYLEPLCWGPNSGVVRNQSFLFAFLIPEPRPSLDLFCCRGPCPSRFYLPFSSTSTPLTRFPQLPVWDWGNGQLRLLPAEGVSCVAVRVPPSVGLFKGPQTYLT